MDSKGKLWFTEYDAAKVGSFNPESEEFKEYNLYLLPLGPMQ
jgi:streptogramin lyase